MPTSHPDAVQVIIPETAIASRRILRLALGSSLCMAFSQVVDWPLSFLAPVFTILFLSLPIPAPSLKAAIGFAGILVGSVLASHLLVPFIDHAAMAGVLLIGLALFLSFYFTAMGGNALVGTFITVALTLLVGVGSVDIDIFLALTKGLAVGSFFGFLFVWVGHAFLPDYPSKPQISEEPKKASPVKPDRKEALRNAFRAFTLVFPIALLLLSLNTSASYAAAMIKVAQMGQQATLDNSREMGRNLIESTIWGGLGGVVIWIILNIWPSLLMYTLLICLAALVYGPKIFQGKGMHPKGAMWQYALITLIIIIAPTVGSMASGDSAADRFWFRNLLFLGFSIYGYLAVIAFNAIWEQDKTT